jgi:hypothetical protein
MVTELQFVAVAAFFTGCGVLIASPDAARLVSRDRGTTSDDPKLP